MVWRMFAFAKLEEMMIRRLLDSPLFHRGVGKIHDKVQRIRHGTPSEDLRVTHKENENGHGAGKFFEYFKEEIRDQVRWKPRDKP
ncbi:hypothetical protein P168DRAFT_314234 [Aspergillus campestris IBT 28561]|uniref:Uncharacterized protein n=1 Tax=Aspergillus campestris (strain IBT 28561) TaxID=1392248 RepID=A0A2I1DE30_ASPC2|nr:uncharacterized protein P168DRAFT_314234 [Aspergillus campestris IBT 28561]PKY08106.1 hypothetical protein P168DRAFT_314234 [Aspergillus campestris IBT 28561]